MTNNNNNAKTAIVKKKKKRVSEAEHRRVQARQRRLQEDPSVRTDLVVCVMTVMGFGALIFISVATFVAARKTRGDYLYAVEGFDHGPVVELLLAINETLPNGTVPAAHPDFLYASKQKHHRMVEFYAPWCGHCQHYRSKYVGTAREIQNMTRDDAMVEVYAVSCTVHRAICRQQNVRAYPTVRFFKAGSINGTDINPFSHPFEILDKMGISYSGKNQHANNSSSLFEVSPKRQRKKLDWKLLFTLSKKKKQFSLRDKHNVFDDAWLSFDFAMRHGVFMENRPLDNETQADLVDWIELLHMTLPPTWKIHDTLNGIRANYESVMNDEAILVKVLDKYPPSATEWSEDCTTNSYTNQNNHNNNKKTAITDSTGYTCGLWQLAHIMSVGVVEYNTHSVETEENLETLTVGNIFRNYIRSFFGCQECRLNFLAAYDACAYDGCNRLSSIKSPLESHWQQLPLWLWETHNGVSVRLQKEHSKKRNEQLASVDDTKVQWPARRDCPKCWREDGSWREDVVYKFLRIQYWPDDKLTEEHRKEVLPLNVQKSGNNDASSIPVWLRIPGVATLFYGVWWYMQRLRRIKSGLHKKHELDV